MRIDKGERNLLAFEKLWDGYSIKDACMVSGLSVREVKKVWWGIAKESKYKIPIYSKSDFDLPLKWQHKKRKIYLSSQINAMFKCLRLIKRLLVCWKDNPQDAGFLMALSEKYQADIKKYKKELYWLNKPVEKKKDNITDFDIERARSVNISSVLPNEVIRGMTKCFIHDDKKPSMKVYERENRVHCFVCNQQFDVIDVVMKTKGLDFISSVRALCTI